MPEAHLPKPRIGRFGRGQILVTLAMAAILATGVFLRIYPSGGFRRLGYDEHAYTVYLQQIEKAGAFNYDSVVRVYVDRQYQRPDAVVPATRIGYLLPAYIIGKLFSLPWGVALRVLNCCAGILTLLVSAILTYRAGGKKLMLGTTFLVATAPLQIHLAQRSLIDGYFAFWAVTALWLAWENLQSPRKWGWLIAYTLSLTMLVLTKENAAFVVFALFGTLLLSHWARQGSVSPYLMVATIVGPALAALLLAELVGGVGAWIQFYAMFVAKSRTNSYSILAQDGPWFRYLVDFILMSPLVVFAAVGCMFGLRARKKPEIFMTIFLALSFLSMAGVTYGLSLRYAAYWDVPLCLLACSQILALSEKFPRLNPNILAVALILIMGISGLDQYNRYFIQGKIYDPVTAELVHAAEMVKSNE